MLSLMGSRVARATRRALEEPVRPARSRALVAWTCLLALAVVSIPSGTAGAQRGRNLERELALMAELMELEPGDTVADVGADDGFYSVRLARRVGPEGRVYATEVTDEKVASIRETVRSAGVDNVVPVRATASDAGLPENCCDALVLRVVYHHLAEPRPSLRDFRAALRPGGRLLIIENRPQRGPNAPGVPENRSGMGIDRDIVVEEVTGAGFEIVRELDDWPSGRYGGHYAFVFREAE